MQLYKWKVGMIVSGAFGLIGIEDGIGYEDIYTLTTGGTAPSKPASKNVNDYVPSGWYASPQSVTSTKRYQWVCKRSKKDGTWSAWSTPVEYNRYVEDGQDGTDGADGTDGVGYEYCYKATQYNVRPDIPIAEAGGAGIPTGWSSSAPDISAINAYIWESYRTVWGNSRTNWKTPKLKNRWSYDGAQGSKGAKMRMRTWESSENYMQGAEGEDFYDIVLYGTQLYLCIKSHYSSASNAPNVSTTYWESAQQWTFIATQFLLAGKIVSDKITADLIDATNLVATDVDISGKITATSGKIGGWAISGNDLICYGFNTRINVEASGSRFMRINDSEEVMCSIRADGNTGLGLSTYGEDNNTIGLDVLCNASGYGYAIRSHGNVLLRARNSEKILINGLSLNSRTVTGSANIYTNDDIIIANNSNDITLYLSTASTPGKMIYIKRKGTGKVTVKGSIICQNANTIVASLDITDYPPRLFFFHGSTWYESSGRH